MAATATEEWKRNTLTKTPGTWRATRSFMVIDATTEVAAIEATGIPVINEAHPNSTTLKCSDVRAVPVGPDVYRVSVPYSVPDDGNEHSGTGANDDPLLTPPTFLWRSVSETVPVEDDYSGNAITDSARKPFSQKPTIRNSFAQLTVTRNEPWYDRFNLDAYENKVNSVDWVIPGTGTLSAGNGLCTSIQPTQTFTELAAYVSVQYSFWIRAGGWGMRNLDQGFYTLASGATKPTKISDSTERQDMSRATLLDGTGRTLVAPVGTGAGTPNGATLDVTAFGAFLTYQMYAPVDFALLNLF